MAAGIGVSDGWPDIWSNDLIDIDLFSFSFVFFFPLHPHESEVHLNVHASVNLAWHGCCQAIDRYVLFLYLTSLKIDSRA